MKIGVIDGGGRGQAIAEKLAQEGNEVFISPGNPGNEDFAESTGIETTDIRQQLQFTKAHKIGLTVVGEDLPLGMGMVDEFKNQSLPVFGPTKAQARIETDRDFAKTLGNYLNMPIGPYQSFSQAGDAIDYATNRQWPLFVKQNGLARGKGAKRCENIDELITVVGSMAEHNLISKERPVVVEDYVSGLEASHHAFCDGLDHLSIPFLVRDHKTVGEADTGPMTGGMGAIGPLLEYSRADAEAIGDQMVAPIVRSLGFRGLLFAGLKGEKLLEWNARPGDPEMQLYLSLLKSDLLPILQACIQGELAKIDPPEWETKKSAANLVLAAEGYPERPFKGDEIEGIEAAKRLGVTVFQAATRREGDRLLTNGGRILNLIAVARTQRAAVNRVYRAAERITFGGRPAVYRKDIGRSPHEK